MAADLYGELLLEGAPPAKRRVRDYLPGVSVTAIAAIAAAWLADHYAAPIVLMGLLIGLSLSFLDRKSVVSGKSVSVRVDLGGRRIIKKKNQQITGAYIHKKMTK